jgi:O-antigen ligase
MHKIAFWLSLAYIFAIPGEVLVEYPALGSGARVIGIALAVCWMATLVINPRIRKPGLFHLVLLLFVLWNVLSIFWSAGIDRTSERIGTWFQLFLMAVILWDLYRTRAAVQAGLQMYILGCYVIIVSTIVNYLTNKAYYFARFSANGTNPDDLGLILALGIAVAFYLASSKERFTTPLVQRWLNYIFPPAALFGIALSGTRTALIAAIPCLLFGLATFSRVRAWVRVALVLLVVVVVLYITPLVPEASFERLGTTVREFAGGELNGRRSLWDQGIAVYAQHPLLGVGSNMYRSTNIEGKVAHNSFLSVLVELGIVGFTLFAVLLAIVVLDALSQPHWESIFWITILACWTIGAFTLTWEYQKTTWLFFSLIVASAAAARTIAENRTMVVLDDFGTASAPGNPDLTSDYSEQPAHA